MSEKIKQFLLLAKDILTEETYQKVLFDIEQDIECIIEVGIGEEPGVKGINGTMSEAINHNTLMSSFL